MECGDSELHDNSRERSLLGGGQRKLVRDSRGGIDWYRYNNMVLEKKLLPFALECKKDRPYTVVQEDNPSPHAHWYQQTTYDLWEVQRMIWPANSPD